MYKVKIGQMNVLGIHEQSSCISSAKHKHYTTNGTPTRILNTFKHYKYFSAKLAHHRFGSNPNLLHRP